MAAPSSLCRSVIILSFLVCSSGLLMAARPAIAKPSKALAEREYRRGEKLYSGGEYREALKAFLAAHAASPHPNALYSAALSHEKLNQLAAALETYRKVLALASDPRQREVIQQHIKRLSAIPTNVFVTSEPAGAEVVLVGSDAESNPRTPAVLPGNHLLLLKKEGYLLATYRLQVKVGEDQPVRVRLAPLPRCADAEPKECPKCPEATCPPCKGAWAPAEQDPGVQVDLSPMLGFGLSLDNPFAVGGGLRGLVVIQRFLVGAQFEVFSTNLQDISLVADGKEFHATSQTWFAPQAKGGYRLTFGAIQVDGMIGLGLLYLVNTFKGKDQTSGDYMELDKGNASFLWTVGATIQARAARWLSLGITAQGGMYHGGAPHANDPSKEGHGNGYFLSTSGLVTFHL